jgi:hypothetical protein
MTFERFPIIETMLRLYAQPRSPDRFQEYLSLLQGDTKGDLAVPIGGFNPMAKEHVAEQLQALQQLGAEDIMQRTIHSLDTRSFSAKNDQTYKVALNLADDLKGGWTNRHTTDYDSKFRFHGMFHRNFCIPYFWTSELHTPELIARRTAEYVFRTVYWQQHPKPKTLKEHVLQEVFVAKQTRHFSTPILTMPHDLEEWYHTHADTEDYHRIFNFFYGDSACRALHFPETGIGEASAGFDYVTMLAG